MHHPVQKWKGHLGRLWGATVAVVALALVVVVAPASAQDDPSVLKVAHTANITTWDPVGKSFYKTEALYMANMYRAAPVGEPARFRGAVHPCAGHRLVGAARTG